ncbi:MAG: YceI family protein [bacterium]
MSARKVASLLTLASVLAAALPASAAPSAAQRFVIVPAESQVIYRVHEVLFNEGNRLNTAVGTTSAVRGEITVDRANPRVSKIGTIFVDISTFRTDSARRDNAIRNRWLESARFPNAEFVPVTISGLPERYTEGQELRLQVTGNLKVRNVVRPNTVFQVTLKLAGNTLTATATTEVLMTDFGFDPPSILGILRAENELRLEFRLVARP